MRPYPNVNAGHWQVSSNGGAEPRWSHSGKELFYRDGVGTGTSAPGSLIAAQVQPGPAFALGAQQRLFAAGGFISGITTQGYVVAPGDDRFLSPAGRERYRRTAGNAGAGGELV